MIAFATTIYFRLKMELPIKKYIKKITQRIRELLKKSNG